MAKYDRISTLFLAVFGVVIGIESLRLEVGSLSQPGPGLFPLGCGLTILVLGLCAFAQTFTQTGPTESIWADVTEWGNVALIPASLIAYAFLIDVLGFSLTTFSWMGFILRVIGKLGWKATAVTALAATIGAWVLFEYYLGIRFPRGVFGL